MQSLFTSPDNVPCPEVAPAAPLSAPAVAVAAPVLVPLGTQAPTQIQVKSQAQVTLGVAAAPAPVQEGGNDDWEELQ